MILGANVRAPKKVHIREGQTAEAEALFFSIGEGAFVTDSHARIDRVNRAALEILGYSEDELLGKWLPATIKVEDEKGNILSNTERPIGQVFVTGKTITTRAVYYRKDGSKVPVQMTVSPVFVGNRPIGAIEVFRDITHEIALERAKDEFVAIASHQLRTPATAVKQYVGLLLEGYADPLTDNQKMFLERAYESNERQLNIVQEILKISQLDLEKVILKPDIHNIANIVSEAVDSVRPNFEKKNQKISIHKSHQPIMARVDKNQLRIAVENILENASNYTWNNRRIDITTRRGKDSIFITVKDEGVGIAKEDLSRLFQKFSRIPNPLSVESGGTGLGLYWAYKIVELHGGDIKVSSIPEKGSSFKIILPKSLQNI